MARRIEGLLFDKDGTILDFDRTWKPISRAVARVASGGDVDLSRTLMDLMGHDPVTDELRAGSPLVAGSAEDIARAWQPYLPGSEIDPLARLIDRVITEECVHTLTSTVDLGATLGPLHQRGLRLGLATSDNEAAARIALDHFGVTGLFDFVCGWDSGHGSKPGPGMVNGFCALTGLAPAQVAVVGDSVHDMEMATAAGAGLRVAVLTGPGTRELLAPYADHVLDDISQLSELLDRLG